MRKITQEELLKALKYVAAWLLATILFSLNLMQLGGLSVLLGWQLLAGISAFLVMLSLAGHIRDTEHSRVFHHTTVFVGALIPFLIVSVSWILRYASVFNFMSVLMFSFALVVAWVMTSAPRRPKPIYWLVVAGLVAGQLFFGYIFPVLVS